MSINKNILFCGGGSGGHYYPLIAIKQELDKSINDKKMYYIGSKYGIESKKIYLENMNNLLIPIRGFNRSFSIQNYIRNFFLIFQKYRCIYKKSGPLYRSTEIRRGFKNKMGRNSKKGYKTR